MSGPIRSPWSVASRSLMSRSLAPSSRSTHARDHRVRDRGASLIVTIGFVLMIGSIGGGLAGLATSSMNNRVSLAMQRDRQYAADAAVESAIATVRGTRQNTQEACAAVTGSQQSTLNGFAIRVDWQHACTVVRGGDGAAVAQRNVIFAACPDQGTPCDDSAVIVRAQVNFEQAQGGGVQRTSVQSWSVNR